MGFMLNFPSTNLVLIIMRTYFFAFMQNEIEKLVKSGQSSTARNYLSAKKSFMEFVDDEYLPFKALTGQLVLEYEKWLKRHSVLRNTSSFYMRQLRSVYNKAVEYRLTTQKHPFTAVYTGVDKTKKRAVNESVITRLLALDVRDYPQSLTFAKDLFLLSFYMCGIAFVDLAYLKKENIKSGVIRYTRHKTDVTMEVKMEGCILEIFNRYAKESCFDYLLPIITEADEKKAYLQYLNKRSYYNKLLKRLSVMLKLEIPLTSYVSRHTWATVARDMNIPISVISAGMGHTSEHMTRIYLASLDESTISQANLKIMEYINSNRM